MGDPLEITLTIPLTKKMFTNRREPFCSSNKMLWMMVRGYPERMKP